MGFPRQEYWSGLSFPPPGDLPDPGIKPEPPSLTGRFFTTMPPGKPFILLCPDPGELYVIHLCVLRGGVCRDWRERTRNTTRTHFVSHTVTEDSCVAVLAYTRILQNAVFKLRLCLHLTATTGVRKVSCPHTDC